MKPILGFVGLGIMGKPMARNLLKSGYEVHVYSVLDTEMISAQKDGAIPENSAAEVAKKADVSIIMVPDTPHVKEVILGKKGFIHSLTSGKVVIDMSTISALATKEFAAEIKKTGASMLDAPVSGGEKGAIEGTLSIMVGGEKEVFERCLPIFEAMGKRITHVGGNSSGQVVKACNNLLGAASVVGMSEALVLGTKAGVDPAKIVEVLSAGAARCWALEVRAPHVIQRDFEPGFKTKLQYKDLGLALELAKGVSSYIPVTSVVHELYKGCVAQGLGEGDYTNVINIIEQISDIEVKSDEHK